MSLRTHPDRRSRADLLAEVMQLRAAGLTHTEIGERIGRTRSTVSNLISDPDGAKARALKASYAGTCADCGGPTDGSNGRDGAPGRCIYCTQGRERPISSKPRLCVPLRLNEISLDARLKGARDAARIYREPDERLAILLAAIQPSNTVYWLAESAKPLLAEIAA